MDRQDMDSPSQTTDNRLYKVEQRQATDGTKTGVGRGTWNNRCIHWAAMLAALKQNKRVKTPKKRRRPPSACHHQASAAASTGTARACAPPGIKGAASERRDSRGQAGSAGANLPRNGTGDAASLIVPPDCAFCLPSWLRQGKMDRKGARQLVWEAASSSFFPSTGCL